MGWGPNSFNTLIVDNDDGDFDSSEGESNGDTSDGENPPNVQQGADVEMPDKPHTSSSGSVPSPELDPDEYQRRMRRHIALIRDFCDGLEYQLPFNDYRMLDALEQEGGQFLRLVEDCLGKEGRLKASLGDYSSRVSDQPRENDKTDNPIATS
jgi:hypothetical protein